MVSRRPLVIQNGLVSELPEGDTVIAGESTTEVVAGSGLVGGGSISSNPRVDFALAANPSGIIYVGDTVGVDGAAQVSADTALASGSAAAFLSSDALASGNASLVEATAALASGNAALDLVPTLGGGGGTSVEIEAASAVASGYAVGLDDTGRVQAVQGSSSSNSNPMVYSGSSTAFESGNAIDIAAVYDSVNDKVVAAYCDNSNSNYGTAVVGTISGSSVSFGTPVVFQSSSINNGYSTGLAYDPVNAAFVVAYTNEGDNFKAYAKVGLVSGTSITFGSAYVLSGTSTCIWMDACYNSSNGTIAITYGDQGLQKAKCVIVEITGTSSLTVGSATDFASGYTNHTSVCFDSTSNKIVCFCRNNSSSNYGYGVVGTVSGTSVSFGTPVVFHSGTVSFINSEYAPNVDRTVVVFRNWSSTTTQGLLGTISGTSISFAGAASVNSSATEFTPGIVYDPVAEKMVVSFEDLGNSYYPTTVALTLTTSSISVSAKAEVGTVNSSSNDVTYSSAANRCVVFYKRFSPNRGDARVADPLLDASYNPTVNSYPNVLGIAQSTVASGSTCLVNLPGTLYNEPAANLTTGAFYYANPTTSGVTTTSTKPALWDGQVPWNYIGRAVTSSGLMLLKSI